MLNSEENDEITETCNEHDTAGFSTRDAETCCDQVILLDADTQCDQPMQRSIQVQTLAIRKRKSTKSKPTTPAQAKNNTGNVTPPTTPITFPERTTSTESEQDVEYSSSSNDEFSDSDDDYVCPELNTNDDSEVEDLKNERKFIVFESMLDQLFISCRTCGSLCEIEKSNRGSMVTVKATCFNNHTYQWNSQPELHNKPAGDILIPAATVITGGSFESTKQFASALNLNFVNKQQFYDVQKEIVFPVIEKSYNMQQKEIVEKIKKEKNPIDLCGDGRSDSPGHSAKYGTYTLMDEKIVDFSLVQVSEVSSSNAMENEGCQRSINKVTSQGIKIRSLTTDRHTQITAELRKKYPQIVHQYDV